MNIVPYTKIKFDTSLTKDEVFDLFKSHYVQLDLFSSVKSNDKPLWGTLNKNSLRLTRAIKYKNSFLPLASLSVIEASIKNQIIIKFNMHVIVNIFMLMWLAGSGLVIYAMLQVKNEIMFGPILMFLFGYLMMQGGFWIEQRKLKKIIIDILNSIS
ncbi:MAG: hypothetical protein OCC49_10535 [Fibrobacterales bacterium]